MSSNVFICCLAHIVESYSPEVELKKKKKQKTPVFDKTRVASISQDNHIKKPKYHQKHSSKL